MKRIAMLLALAAALLSCEQRVRTVNVVYGDNREGLSGFLCLQDAIVDDDVPLVARAVSGGTFNTVNLVVDLIDVGNGIPSCRAQQILSWCADYDCHARKGHRVVQELDLTGLNPNSQTIIDQTFERVALLDGSEIFHDVPDGKTYILRVVGSIQPKAELEATGAGGEYLPFDESRLLGVAYSCPVVLASASGDLFLGFDALDNRCEQGVIRAAQNF